MKILGDAEGYSLIEFCEEADRYVFVAEIWDKKPYSLSMTDLDDIIKARHVTQRASEALACNLLALLSFSIPVVLYLCDLILACVQL